MQGIALDIFSFCMFNYASFQVPWIPRSENGLADYLSWIIDPKDCMLSPSLFRLISDKRGPFDVHRMDCHYNAQLSRFNFKLWCPGTKAVDRLTRDWGGNCHNFVCLSPYLIHAVLLHIKCCKAKGFVAVPQWKSAAFWPVEFLIPFC